MELAEANRLLDPGYLDFEAGYTRLPDGQLHVASWTTMFGCSGQMVEWWFGFLENTEQYKWWHPRDHVWCEWIGERDSGKFVGGTHHVHEYIGGDLQKLKINFREPAEYLDVARFSEAGITAAVCGRVGPLDTDFWAGHLIHLCRDTDYGCEMRSRFWLGDLDPPELAPDAATRTVLFPDSAGEALLKHCHEEMSYLAGFLPDLYSKHVQPAGR
ncbi:MAG TPA: hypothetical protein EYG16_09710 [Deltaproteobacteria bacterium]|nr:hypothetical protein [Deltaproteobacteria bacterium]